MLLAWAAIATQTLDASRGAGVRPLDCNVVYVDLLLLADKRGGDRPSVVAFYVGSSSARKKPVIGRQAVHAMCAAGRREVQAKVFHCWAREASLWLCLPLARLD